MELTKLLKAMSDETRFKILTLLLEHNYCVRGLAKKLDLSEAAVSQHLKILKEAELIVGEKKGYFMHYDVKRDKLHQISSQIEELALIERKTCKPENANCKTSEKTRCHNQKDSSNGYKEGCRHNHGSRHRYKA